MMCIALHLSRTIKQHIILYTPSHTHQPTHSPPKPYHKKKEIKPTHLPTPSTPPPTTPPPAPPPPAQTTPPHSALTPPPPSHPPASPGLECRARTGSWCGRWRGRGSRRSICGRARRGIGACRRRRWICRSRGGRWLVERRAWFWCRGVEKGWGRMRWGGCGKGEKEGMEGGWVRDGELWPKTFELFANLQTLSINTLTHHHSQKWPPVRPPHLLPPFL